MASSRANRGLLNLVLTAVALAPTVLAPAGLPAGPVRAALTTGAAYSMMGLHVQGNQIVNSGGQPVRLLGANRSGTEYAFIKGAGIFDGPTDLASAKGCSRGTSTPCVSP